ncbi:hypothetical protein BGM19_14425 [Streptomyces agglomeratus]|uniref:hypothetical protein n=1 Tax=Streptomyces agglomeratus TaxID=285458 RepID=UPI00086C2715|nr:hypothetical protein [Streptomyces agglomeratus]OEJ59013.1 hypothetical protein BGM19_14425 [Streptomyces agglomeratus]
MNHNTPVSPRPLSHLTDARRRVLCAAQLRAHGVSAAKAAAQCRPGGPWQQILPGVYVLHAGPPTSEERLHAALLYAGRPTGSALGTVVPAQVRTEGEAGSYGEVMITGLAALALHRFSAAPSPLSLERIDVLVPRTRRLRSTGCARLIRVHAMPAAQEAGGLPVAPVARALADAVAHLTDADAVRRLLTEAVRGGHCEPAAVVKELTLARLLSRPHVIDAVNSLLAEGRAIAEDRLYALVRNNGLPDPLWNVDLRLPGGPHLGGVDIYWPDQAVAVELDTRAPRPNEDAPGSPERSRELGEWSEYARKREHLERLGITVVHITPKKLRETPEQQATVVRTALMAAGDREPPAYVVVLPR